MAYYEYSYKCLEITDDIEYMLEGGIYSEGKYRASLNQLKELCTDVNIRFDICTIKDYFEENNILNNATLRFNTDFILNKDSLDVFLWLYDDRNIFLSKYAVLIINYKIRTAFWLSTAEYSFQTGIWKRGD